MIEQTWQEKTDETLERIESQIDNDPAKQLGFATDFREKVITSLTKIESALIQNEKDHTEIKTVVSKIPAMEIGLNNHLKTHDTLKKAIFYPVAVIVIGGLITVFCKLVLHVF